MIYGIEDLEKLKIDPDKYDHICIDVGLAIDAPHAAHWMMQNSRVCVIGFEPNIQCVKVLYEGREATNKFCYVRFKDNHVIRDAGDQPGSNPMLSYTYPEGQFLPFNMAIDDVEVPTKRDFYYTDERNLGCSSLLEPTESLNLDITSVEPVDVVSLEYVLEKLGADAFDQIAYVKTDAQGKDFDVIKSLGRFLPRVVGIKSEINVKDYYKNPNDADEFVAYLRNLEFTYLFHDGFDAWFIHNAHAEPFIKNHQTGELDKDNIYHFLKMYNPAGLD